MLDSSLFAKYPKMNNKLKNLIYASKCSESWRLYHNWICKVISALPRRNQDALLNNLGAPNDNGYLSAIAEIAFCAFWGHLKWDFIKDPNIDGKRPDFLILPKPNTRNKSGSFICEITLVHNDQPHTKNEIINDGGKIRLVVNGVPTEKLPIITQPIDQVHRIVMEIEQKLRKYDEIAANMPLVVGLFQKMTEDFIYLGPHQIRNALYGDLTIGFPTGNLSLKPELLKGERGNKLPRGLFAFESSNRLASVIVCREHTIDTEYGWVAVFDFEIYNNPASGWTAASHNPFSVAGLGVNGLNNEIKLDDKMANPIRFYKVSVICHFQSSIDFAVGGKLS